MPTQLPSDTARCPPTTTLAASEILPLLANEHRRYTLHYLAQQAGAVSLGELVEQIALWAGEPTHDYYERVLTGLHHSHLPALVAHGLVAYDEEAETLTGLDTLD